jgi:ferric iron reductase protein FhuF
LIAAEVVAAIERAGRDNPLLGIGLDDGGRPSSDVDSTAGELIRAVGAWAGTAERRVAGSLVVLGYAARLVGPTLAVLVRDGIRLGVAPERVRYSYRPETGFRLSLPSPGGRRVAREQAVPGWCADVIDGHLRRVVDAIATTSPVAAGLLWGNVASGVVGALRALGAGGAVPVGDAHALAVALLDHGPLRGSGTVTVHGGQLTFVRRSCCLFYRLDGGGMCGDCALVRR